MTGEQWAGAGLYLLGVLMATASQLLLKRSAMIKHESRLREYLNAPVIIAYALLLASTVLTVLALKTLPVSLAAVLGAMEYVFVTAASWALFHERLSRRMLAGVALILLGVSLAAL